MFAFRSVVTKRSLLLQVTNVHGQISLLHC